MSFPNHGVFGGIGNPILCYNHARFNGNTISVDDPVLDKGVFLKPCFPYKHPNEQVNLAERIQYALGKIEEFPLSGRRRKWELTWKVAKLNEDLTLICCEDGSIRTQLQWLQELLRIDNLYRKYQKMLLFYPHAKKDDKYEVIIDDLQVEYCGDKAKCHEVTLNLISVKLHDWNLEAYFDYCDPNPYPGYTFVNGNFNALGEETSLGSSVWGRGCYSELQIYVSDPKDGDSYAQSSTLTVNWEAGSLVGSTVDVYLSRNDGSTWTKLNMMGIPKATGTYDWTVSGSGSAVCKMKVTDGTYDGISNGNFTVQSPS